MFCTMQEKNLRLSKYSLPICSYVQCHHKWLGDIVINRLLVWTCFRTNESVTSWFIVPYPLNWHISFPLFIRWWCRSDFKLSLTFQIPCGKSVWWLIALFCETSPDNTPVNSKLASSYLLHTPKHLHCCTVADRNELLLCAKTEEAKLQAVSVSDSLISFVDVWKQLLFYAKLCRKACFPVR